MWLLYIMNELLQEISLRPDIRLGKVPSRSSSASPLPSSQPEFSLPPPSTSTLNYSSAFMCRLPLFLIQSRPQPPLPALERRDPDFVSIDIDKLGGGEVMDQSHLTRVVVGCDEDIQDIQHTEDILQQVKGSDGCGKGSSLRVVHPLVIYKQDDNLS